MSGAEITQLIKTLTEIAAILDKLGVPGLIFLFLVGPAAILIVILVLEHLRNKELNQMIAQHREDNQKLVEAYRTDTQHLLAEMSSNHSEVSQYYKDNVLLTKTTQQLAGDLRETVAYNTRVLERVLGVAENNMFCPLARQNARGSK